MDVVSGKLDWRIVKISFGRAEKVPQNEQLHTYIWFMFVRSTSIYIYICGLIEHMAEKLWHWKDLIETMSFACCDVYGLVNAILCFHFYYVYRYTIKHAFEWQYFWN